MLSVTPRLILAELRKRGIEAGEVDSISPAVFLEFADRQGKHQYINGVVTAKSSAVGCRIADDKLVTATLAARIGVPVPATMVYDSADKALAFLRQYGQVVVKPLDGAHGNGVTVGVDAAEKLTPAVGLARQFSETVLVQQQVSGRDLRLLFIGGELAAATHRKTASIVGDGQRTVEELIEQTNQDPERGEKYQKKYNRISLAAATAFLGERIRAIPSIGEEVQVVGTANMGSGGTAIDVTDAISQHLVDYSKKLVAELGAGVWGVDFIEDGDSAYLIEANASPSFGLHVYPHEGMPRDVTAKFVDWLLGTDVN